MLCTAVLAVLSVHAVTVGQGRPDPAVLDAAPARFLGASSREDAARLVDDVLRSGVDFESAYARLKRGRAYSRSVPLGVQQRTHRPRDPLPDGLSWETDRIDRYNRAHWLIVDELGGVDGETRLEDTNLIARSPVLMVQDIFPRRRPSERVEKRLATLVRWAARDNDRTMLFGAEIRVRVR